MFQKTQKIRQNEWRFAQCKRKQSFMNFFPDFHDRYVYLAKFLLCITVQPYEQNYFVFFKQYAALLSEFLAFITYLASKNYGPQLQPAD